MNRILATALAFVLGAPLAFAAPSTSADNPPAAVPIFKVGDRVLLKVGSDWKPGTLIAIEKGRYRVKLDGGKLMEEEGIYNLRPAK